MKIPCAGVVYDYEEISNIKDAAETFWLVEGKYTKQFEHDLCKYMGMKYCVLCNSGSSANLLAVSALELPKGSEVITTACGFPTTLNPIIQNELVPVFVDIDSTLTIDTQRVEKAISKKTKAIVVAHTLGIPADMVKIMKIAKKYKLRVIEDNCDALGSRLAGKLTGTFGDISTLSFYPAHHITTGEGGAVMTNDYGLYRKVLSYRNWGRDCICRTGQDNACGKRFKQQFGDLPYGYDHKYVYSRIGYNLKMADLQAAIGVAQLKKLPEFIKIRRGNVKRLESILPMVDYRGDPSWFGFPILTGSNQARSEMTDFLESKGIATRVLFGGNLFKQPAYKNIKHRLSGGFGYTDRVMDSLFWIGVYPGLGDKEIGYIIEQFKKFTGRSK